MDRLPVTARFIVVQVCAFLTSSVAGAAAQSDFDQVVRPYLERHCTKCHGAEIQKGKLTLHMAEGRFDTDAQIEGWVEILDRLTFEEMPPPEEELQPDSLATGKIVAWIKGQLEETGTGEAYRKKLLAPEYGNWVSHEELFSGEIRTPPYSPARLWRLSPDVFMKKGFPGARSPFAYVTKETGIRDYSSMSAVDQSTVQMILINADQVLEHRQKRGDFKRFEDDQQSPSLQVLEDTVRREYRSVIGREPNEAERAKYQSFLQLNIAAGGNVEGLKNTIKAMFLSAEANYRNEFGLGATDKHGRRHLDPEEIAYALAYALTDRGPEHMPPIWNAYKADELADKQDVVRIVRELMEHELGSGRWSDLRLPRVMRFFEEFFGFDRAGGVFKDNQRKQSEGIPQWNPAMLIHDARMLIEYHLEQDQDFIAELLTTDQYFIAHPGDNDYAREMFDRTIAEMTQPDYVESAINERRVELEQDPNMTPERQEENLGRFREQAEWNSWRILGALEDGLTPFTAFPYTNRSRGIADLIYIEPYNLPSNNDREVQRWSWEVEQPLAMPSEQRAGLLTHPAWLAAHSLNEGNDPIRRGIWVREKLLAGVIQDVPPDVDATVSNDPHMTLRERLEPLRAERCWSCHKKMNPLGETFEIFDDWGRYRTHLYFDEDEVIVTRRDREFDRMLQEGKLTTRPVDASGALSGSGDPGVDGPVEDAIEMLHRLGRSTRARQSFIRHLFRYFMGRNEMLSDSITLIDAEQAYLETGGSFQALVISLLSSDSFLYRR